MLSKRIRTMFGRVAVAGAAWLVALMANAVSHTAIIICSVQGAPILKRGFVLMKISYHQAETISIDCRDAVVRHDLATPPSRQGIMRECPSPPPRAHRSAGNHALENGTSAAC